MTAHPAPSAARRAVVAAALVPALVLAAAATPAMATTARGGGPARPVDTWAASADRLHAAAYTDSTVRDIVHTSIGGRAPRVRLSNAFGTGPVTFDAVYLGPHTAGAGVESGANERVRFGGSPTVTVPPGAEVASDPVPMTVPGGSDLAVSIHVRGATGQITGHNVAEQDSYLAPGNVAAQSSASAFTTTTQSWYWLDAVSVQPAAAAHTVVALGDSITDGYQSTPNTNNRWPDVLGRRLARAGTAGVANEGISGNDVTADTASYGVSAQARLDRDVLSQPRVGTVIFLEGINDIGNGLVTARQLIQGDKQVIARVHAAGARIVGATLTPFRGSFYYSAAKERIREAVNAWIRHSGAFDAVVDFDRVVRDPAHPHQVLPRYDSGDHLHPDDAGYQAMGRAVPLSVLG